MSVFSYTILFYTVILYCAWTTLWGRKSRYFSNNFKNAEMVRYLLLAAIQLVVFLNYFKKKNLDNTFSVYLSFNQAGVFISLLNSNSEIQ